MTVDLTGSDDESANTNNTAAGAVGSWIKSIIRPDPKTLPPPTGAPS